MHGRLDGADHPFRRGGVEHRVHTAVLHRIEGVARHQLSSQLPVDWWIVEEFETDHRAADRENRADLVGRWRKGGDVAVKVCPAAVEDGGHRAGRRRNTHTFRFGLDRIPYGALVGPRLEQMRERRGHLPYLVRS